MNNSEYNRLHKVLLIDHQVETAKNTSFLLELAGYEVTWTRGLDEAINFVSTFWPEEDGPAIVLIDNLQINSACLSLIDLLAERCRNSKFLIVNREEQADNPSTTEHNLIAPRHLLGALRKIISQPAVNNGDSDCFHRIHPHG